MHYQEAPLFSKTTVPLSRAQLCVARWRIWQTEAIYGFAIHGCIDGFSQRVLMWLKVSFSNNRPKITASYYVECVSTGNVCPTLLRTDRGTESGHMAAIQVILRRQHADDQAESSHRYGTSVSNQRMQVSRRTWREAARFPESGVLPLSLTTQHEEVMGRICFVYGCSHRSDGEKCSFFRFPTHVIQRGRWKRLCR